MLEAAADGGALKTERKGVSLYRVGCTAGPPTPASNRSAGVNAAVELAHQVLAMAALGDPARGTTVTPTLLRGRHRDATPCRRRREFAVDVRVRDAAPSRTGSTRACARCARCCPARGSR